MIASVAVHGVALVLLGNLRDTDLAQAATKIEVFDAQAEEAPPPPPPPPPPEPKAEPPKPKARAAAPEAEPAPPLATDLGPSPLAAAPDFGLSLSGGVAVAPASAAPQRAQAQKPTAHSGPVRAAANLKPVAQTAASACSDPPAKPKVRALPRPAYTDQARAAGVEGKVRIQLTVDGSGMVTQVRVLQGLGYGLDEAAVQAAKQARFEPVVRCGKPESSTFTIAMRFTAS